MSDTNDRQMPGQVMIQGTRKAHIDQCRAGEASQSPSGEHERLQVIHELVRSGDYHVPAAAVADRIIERMIGDRRSQQT